MGLLQNQNLTQGFSKPEVPHWESTLHLSPAVNNTIVVLGMLTFALQLCLVLFFMLRCWRLDNGVRKALQNPDAVNKLTVPSSFHLDIYRQDSYQRCDNGTASPSTQSAAGEQYALTNSLVGQSIPWDLVQ